MAALQDRLLFSWRLGQTGLQLVVLAAHCAAKTTKN
jgi:hypothetical protein